MSDINITVNDEIVNIDVLDTPVIVEVSNSPGPAGAGVAAGGTTGQVLAKASNTNYDTVWVNPSSGGVPYSGATGDVSLGEYGINLGNIIYDTTPTGIPTEQGAMYWDADAETVALIMNGTIQKIGEDTFYHVRNTTGSTIPKGTAVRFVGTTGNSGRLLIAPMLANGTYPSQYYMGITSEELVNNADGKVYHFGKMRNINTSAFADGDVLYVSPSVAGALTATAPVAPNNIIVAAAVVHAANNGTLMVRTTLGSNINSDEGVLLTTPTANQGLFYDSGLWVNKSITTALGYTPANAATTLTINGVTYDLSTSRTWTIAAGISGSGTSGQVTYWSGASAVSGSNNLFWDAANSRLGIGTNAPAYQLEVSSSSGSATSGILVKNTATGASVFSSINLLNNNNNIGQIFITSSTYTNAPVIGANGFGHYTNGQGGITLWADTSIIKFVTGAAGGLGTQKMTLFTTGNLGIGTGNSDLGVRLQVIGDTLLRGSGATSATTALTVQNSSSTNLFTVRNDGNVGIGTASPISKIETFNTSIYVAGAFSMYSNTASDESIFYFRRGRGNLASPLIVQSGDVLGSLRFAAQFNSTVGGYNTNSKIDSVAESNGADLRFYTNNAGYSLSPTERIRIKSNGQVRFVPLASAPSGAEAGDVYYNSTDNKHYGYNGTTWNAFY